jgi:RNA polymerase sigma-70 factor (ECF subfamily)
VKDPAKSRPDGERAQAAAPEEADEGERARRIARGDEQAWRRLYDETCASLFNLLCYQVGDREAAKDLLQETYLTAARQINTYRGEGSLHGWLRAIALRKSIDWRRALGRRLRLRRALAARPVEQSDPAPDVHLASEREAIDAALRKLSARQRAVILLRDLEGLTFAEIAASLQCQEPTARVHYHRARESLKQLLASSGAHRLADEWGGQQA